MDKEDRQRLGRMSRKFEDEVFVEAVRDNDPASSSEVAEHVGCSRQNAVNRLRRLVDDGEVGHKKIANVNVWFIPRTRVDEDNN